VRETEVLFGVLDAAARAALAGRAGIDITFPARAPLMLEAVREETRATPPEDFADEPERAVVAGDFPARLLALLAL